MASELLELGLRVGLAGREVNSEELAALLQGATARYDSVVASVTHCLDRAHLIEGMRDHPSNSALAIIADDMERCPTSSGTERVSRRGWNIWMRRPDGWHIEHIHASGITDEIAGGNASAYWQYFPAVQRASRLPQDHDPLHDQTRWLLGMFPPVVAELLDPSFLFAEPDGATKNVRLKRVGETIHGGRPTIIARAAVEDWDSRTPWSDTVLVAERYELFIDAQVGALLRVACFRSGVAFGISEISAVEWNPVIPDATFELDVPPGT